MGFLKNVFGNKEVITKPNSFWNYLEEVNLDEIEKESFTKPIAIFKHSTTCGISKFVWNRFQKEFDIPNEQMDFYYLDLLANRSVSNHVAEKFNVVHQSPQVILIKNGKVIYNASHESIHVQSLKEFL
jgi:bacillithiol system protein YtxJ